MLNWNCEHGFWSLLCLVTWVASVTLLFISSILVNPISASSWHIVTKFVFFPSPLSLLYFLLAVQIIEYISASIWNNTVLCSVQPHLRSPITTKVQNLDFPCVTLARDEDWLHLKHSHCGRTCWSSELKILGCWLGGLVKSHFLPWMASRAFGLLPNLWNYRA